MITKKRRLEMALESISSYDNPKAHLEQYNTPSKIAADLLWNAKALGDIQGLKIADLGCGTGIFSIGAALLGAGEVVGVEVDREAIDIAMREAASRGLGKIARFVHRDILEFKEEADTVIQNPPFGAQKKHRKKADRLFIEKSMEIAPVVYSFHIMETLDFVKEFFQSFNGEITNTFSYKFPIPRIYEFHSKEEVLVDIIVVRVEKRVNSEMYRV